MVSSDVFACSRISRVVSKARTAASTSPWRAASEPSAFQVCDNTGLRGPRSFSCSAFVPGVQINCTGATSAAFEVITGQFVIAGKGLCTEPRVDPILTVTDVTATATVGGTKAAPTATATSTQYVAGPSDLGRPWGCKGDRFGGNTRLGDHPPSVVLPVAAMTMPVHERTAPATMRRRVTATFRSSP